MGCRALPHEGWTSSGGGYWSRARMETRPDAVRNGSAPLSNKRSIIAYWFYLSVFAFILSGRSRTRTCDPLIKSSVRALRSAEHLYASLHTARGKPRRRLSLRYTFRSV